MSPQNLISRGYTCEVSTTVEDTLSLLQDPVNQVCEEKEGLTERERVERERGREREREREREWRGKGRESGEGKI